jgi:MFS family permease
MIRIAFVVGAGIVAALQIGKAVIAIPSIQQELALTLVQASTLLSVFAVFGAAVAMPAGLAAPRFGARRCLTAGLLLIAIGSFAGGLSPNFVLLLATRTVEGMGFILVATSAPALLTRLTSDANRAPAFAVWGVYMPAGMGLMILTGMVIEGTGWRALWHANGAIALLWLAGAQSLLPADRKLSPAALSNYRIGATLRAFAEDGRPFLVAATFFFYGNLYFAVTGLLPVFLIGEFGLSATVIAPLTAAVIFVNGGGNLLAGLLLRRGVAFDRIIAWAFAGAALVSIFIFVGLQSVVAVMLVACLAMGIAGLVPASVMASAPTIARDLGHVGAMIGLFMQGSTFGQFTGPPVMAFLAERFGWPAGALFITLLGLCALALITLLRRVK